MAFLETPSRILRRMEALEAKEGDLPSLPSLPAFEDSAFVPSSSTRSLPPNVLDIEDEEDEVPVPYQSTPAPAPSQTTRSTVRPPPSTSSSATRFANSMRASASTAKRSQVEQEESFEVSRILPAQRSNGSSTPDISSSNENVPEDQINMQRHMEEYPSFGNTVEPVGRSSSPLVVLEEFYTPASKKYDYSVSLRSEPKASPINPYRNVSIRKPVMSRTRTPSLSRTTPSPTSTSSDSTPISPHSHTVHQTNPLVSSMERTQFQDPTDHPAIETGQEYEQDLSHTEDVESLHIEERLDQDIHENEDQSDQESGRSSPEPTFSSDEQPQSSGSPGTRTPFPKAFSSPAPSAMAIQTPLHVPYTADSRVEGTPMPPQSSSEDAQDLATPYNRRRSFLLSLVHSTARPRMTFPTPHPNIRTGVTPRPRRHPLSQAWTPAPAQFAREPGSDPASGSTLSPHDRLSFISTTSSHDLTVHPRANTSFDPVTGAKGVGRFNAVKLNTYLHGLNRRLQEENETLVGRLRMHGEEIELGKAAEALEREGFKDIEEAMMQEVDAMRDDLQRCQQEKDALGAERDALYGQLEALKSDKEEINSELRTEQEERKKDKARWKDRMAEVESGVEGVIKELERRLEEAEGAARGRAEADDEARELEEKYVAIQGELEAVNLRAKKAEIALASSSDLGAELKQANECVAAKGEEVRAANKRASDLERRLRDVEQKGEAIKAALQNQLKEMDTDIRCSLEAQQSAQAHTLELEAELKVAENNIDELEEQLAAARQNAADALRENGQLQAQRDRLTEDVARAVKDACQMEDAIEESERKMLTDEQELASLRARISHLEHELETQRESSKSSAFLDSDPRARSSSETEQLEAELDAAHREIAKLKHLLSESPSRKAIDKAKDMRIKLLEGEKDELYDRVRALRSMILPPEKQASPATKMPTPHRQVSFRSPLTPGAPLKDYSWLQANSTMPHASPLVAQIEHLQQELNLANESIDAKVGKLDEARMGFILEKNKARVDRSSIVKTIASLESDLRRVRDDAEVLGRDLKELKSERDQLEIRHKDELGKGDRAQKQLHAQVRLANEQLEAQREKATRAIADLENHVCELNQQDIEKLRMQHKNECKGLMVQIRYLKAKFARESLFRTDLAYQKHYLLSILAHFERSETQILAAVARIGFPSQSQPVRNRRTLRAIGTVALFIAKAKKASESWREQSASTPAVAAALQEVRRRRVTGSLGYL